MELHSELKPQGVLNRLVTTKPLVDALVNSIDYFRVEKLDRNRYQFKQASEPNDIKRRTQEKLHRHRFHLKIGFFFPSVVVRWVNIAWQRKFESKICFCRFRMKICFNRKASLSNRELMQDVSKVKAAKGWKSVPKLLMCCRLISKLVSTFAAKAPCSESG